MQSKRSCLGQPATQQITERVNKTEHEPRPQTTDMCTPTQNKVRAKRATWSRRPSVARNSKTTAAATLPTLEVVHQFTNCWHDLAINQFGSAVTGRGDIPRGGKMEKNKTTVAPSPEQ
jgi:hypothetical protein